MARFLSNALRYLDGFFQVEGSQPRTDFIDLSSVQLVQDVRSMTVAGTGAGLWDGFITAVIGHQSDIGGSTEVSTLNPYTGGDPPNQGWQPFSPLPARYDFWALAVFANVTSPSNITEMAISWRPPSQRVGPQSNVQGNGAWGLLRGSSADGSFEQMGVGTPVSSGYIPFNTAPIIFPRPLYLMRGGQFWLRSVTTVQTRIQAEILMRAVPKGSYL